MPKGFTLNGNTLVIIMAGCFLAVLASFTVIYMATQTVPAPLPEVLIGLSGALVGGGLVNHVNTHPIGGGS